MLLLRCKILGKRWRRRALALAAAGGRARPASKAATSTIGVPTVDLNATDEAGPKERPFAAPAGGAPFHPPPPHPPVPEDVPGSAQTAVPAAVLADSAPTQAEAAALAATNGTLGTAAALTGNADGWYYDPVDPGSGDGRQGPYTLEQLQQWVGSGHFALEDIVYEGCDGPHIALGAAFAHHGLVDAAAETPAVVDTPTSDAAADGWYYDDDDGSARHGPYTLELLQGWVDGGHFRLADTVYNGYDGPCVTLRDAFASSHAAAVGAVEEGNDASRPLPSFIPEGAGIAPIRGSLAHATMYGGYTI